MTEWITDPQIWIALVTLTVLEIVLGIDNIIFITILAGKLPRSQAKKGRQVGLVMAMITRILLLLSLSYLTRLTTPIASIFKQTISARDLILIIGGLFLLGKSTFEMHDHLEGVEGHRSSKIRASFGAVIVQIIFLDIIFSLDSVITAIGMVEELGVMIAAVITAVGVMLYASGGISQFVDDHPTLKILALSFLLLIGFSLVAEGFHFHIPKGYIYFAMGFSVFVEMINLRLREKMERRPLDLRKPYTGS